MGGHWNSGSIKGGQRKVFSGRIIRGNGTMKSDLTQRMNWNQRGNSPPWGGLRGSMYRCRHVEITGLVFHGGEGAGQLTVGHFRLSRRVSAIVTCPVCLVPVQIEE